MEITNNSQHYSIPLVVGRRIAQIIFFETGPILSKDYSAQGKYQTTTDLKKMMKDWSPTSMLPKVYLDRDIKNKK
jgi:deoxycytidine triphosphate deaminase